MNEGDLARLTHMLDSSKAVLMFIKDENRESLDTNRMLLSGLIRELEVLGEAAGKISIRTQKRFSYIPWKQIIGMRNRLIHAYFDIDHDILWNTVIDFIPTLSENLEEIISTYKWET